MTNALRTAAAAALLAMAGLPSGAGAQVRGAADLASVAADTVALPGPGRVTGVAAAGIDTVAYLLDIAGTESATGRREVRLQLQDARGAVLRDEDFTGVLDRALAWTGQAFYACGDAPDGSSILYEIRPDSLGGLAVQKAVTAPGHRPTALAWDGRYLWLSDRDSGRLDRFDPGVDDFTRFTAAPGFSPCGLAWDGVRMWLTDVGTGRLYRLAGGRLDVTGVVDALSFLQRGAATLLWHDGRDLWYLPEGQRIAVRLEFP
ncbi:MAG: hypothetical protein ABR506_11770 [Candidatus Krumholzibacteriia bacterium]